MLLVLVGLDPQPGEQDPWVVGQSGTAWAECLEVFLWVRWKELSEPPVTVLVMFAPAARALGPEQ